ncbi:hypothetical protein [Tumebacillus avium]|uniref:hypothetical protein n=1 Tax=Tumebacillus avium TaxID=1903704 RepID=UPI0012FD33B1|nr:hypothetical protein [Tumebacillus avium]
MDNIGRFFMACILFPIGYCTITLMLSEELGADTLNQLNFGIVIGLLIFILVKQKKA